MTETPKFNPHPLAKADKLINLRMTNELHIRVKSASVTRKVTIHDLVIQAIEFALDNT